MKVAFQGEIGAFSEQAAYDALGREASELVPLPSFEEVFRRLEATEVDRAVIPIENSLYGSVHANYDLLRIHNVRIISEINVRIEHNLLALPGETIESIRSVRSHPQALGQCQAFLKERLPHAEVIPAYDTAGAAKEVAELRIRHAAAIASHAAAKEYGLDILASGIETNQHNYTRFLVLAPAVEAPRIPAGDGIKTSIVYAMKQNVPGALFKALAVFALRDLDLYKIESRPIVGSPFAYLFYVDFEGSELDEVVERALDHLSEIAGYLKVLGSYPVAGLPT